MAPMKGDDRSAKRDQPGKHASGPTGNREVGCGTVVLYDVGENGCRPFAMDGCRNEAKPTLQQQLDS